MSDNDENKPWYNDGDKVAGMITTIFMVTITVIVCMVAIAFAARFIF